MEWVQSDEQKSISNIRFFNLRIKGAAEPRVFLSSRFSSAPVRLNALDWMHGSYLLRISRKCLARGVTCDVPCRPDLGDHSHC